MRDLCQCLLSINLNLLKKKNLIKKLSIQKLSFQSITK